MRTISSLGADSSEVERNPDTGFYAAKRTVGQFSQRRIAKHSLLQGRYLITFGP